MVPETVLRAGLIRHMVRRGTIRRGMALVAGLALVGAGVSGCGSDDPAPATTPTSSPPAVEVVATPTASASPTTSAEPAADRIHPTGIGPLVMAATLTQLQATGAITNVQPIAQCPDWSTADGTGDYAFVHATFSKGALAWIEVSTTTVSTVDGAQLGMALDEVSGMYGGRGVPLTNTAGAKAIGVPGEPNTGSGLLMRTNEFEQVSSIEAGTYDLLEHRFVEGKGC